jgi:Glyoxalase-like domain
MAMEMRLRQIALVAQDLDAAHADICALFGLANAFEDPGVGKYGLRNAVFALGNTFLEVVSPTASGTTAGRLLEKRGGDGGYMVILQTDRIDNARDTIIKAGARIVDQFDGDGVAFTHIHPRDVGGAILSVDYMNPRDRWDWAGPEWQSHNGGDRSLTIVGVELQAEAPHRMAGRWAEVLGTHAEVRDGNWCIDLGEGQLRFTGLKDDRGEGLSAFDVTARDLHGLRNAAEQRGLVGAQGEIMLCGTIVRLVERT